MKFRASIFIIICILFKSYGYSQEDCFEKGVSCFLTGNYKQADSLFTQDLCRRVTQNSYYNRGMTRLMLKDTVGYCNDMIAADYLFSDAEAINAFNNLCCLRVDTSYFDRKYRKSDKQNFKYFEILKVRKYSNDTLVEVHDKISDGIQGGIMFSDCNKLDPVFRKTDVIAYYKLQPDNTKIYTFTEKPPSYRDPKSYIMHQIENSTYYQEVKKSLNLDKTKVQLLLTIDTDGKVKDVAIKDVEPKIEQMDELKMMIRLIYINLPPFQPGTFLGKKVLFQVGENLNF